MIVRELVTKLGFDFDASKVKQAEKSFQSFKQQAESTLRSMRNIGLGMSVALTAPIVALGKSFIREASNAQESENRFRQVFGNISDEAEKFSKNLGDAVGRSTIDIKEGITVFQQFAQGLGFAVDESFKFSSELQQLSLDFASFQNISDEEAMTRFISALSGSAEVLDKFGINIKVSALEQEALSMGIRKSFNDMNEMEKATLRLNVIRKVMGKNGAIGDAVRTSQSYENQLKAMNAELKDLRIEFGNMLLPVALKVVKAINSMAKQFQTLSPELKKAILGFGALLAVIGPVLVGISGLGFLITGVSSALPYLTVAVAGLSVAFNSLIWPISGVIAVLAGAYLLFEDIEVWAKGGNALFAPIYEKTIALWSSFKGFLKSQFDEAKAMIDRFINYITSSKIYQFFKPFGDAVDLKIGQGVNAVVKFDEDMRRAGKSLRQNIDNKFNSVVNVNVENASGTPDEIAKKVDERVRNFYDTELRVSVGDLLSGEIP